MKLICSIEINVNLNEETDPSLLEYWFCVFLKLLSLLSSFFEIGSPYVAKAGVEFMILLPQHPQLLGTALVSPVVIYLFIFSNGLFNLLCISQVSVYSFSIGTSGANIIVNSNFIFYV